MTAPRPWKPRRPQSPPDRLPPRRGGGSSPSHYTYASAAVRPAGPARPCDARRELVRSARALAAAACISILGVLALPAAARTDGPMSVPGQAEQVCRPLPSGPPTPTCDGGTERGVILVGGSAPSEGSVRICHDNEFRSVCDDFFTHRGAGVVCRQLGYPTGVPTYRSRFVGDAGPVSYWLDDVDCRSTEANLGDCPHPGWGLHNCGANERAGVICTTRVTGMYAVGGERQVSLAWDEPGSRYDRGFTGHEYRYKTLSEDGYGPWRTIPDSASRGANVASYTVTGLFEGTWYTFQVRILGGGNASEPGTSGVRTAGEANRLPEFAGPQERSVAENAAAGAAVGEPVTASDADGETLRYSLEAVDDHASFTIEPSSGQIRTKAAHDHETRSRYSVTVKADDGEGGAGTVAVRIEIADVEEQPTDAEIVTGPGPDGVWNDGERVEARVRFGVPVHVQAPAGGRAPELVLAFYGGGGRVGSFGRAAYTGGSGTDTLSFAYTVTQADAGAASVVAPRNALRKRDAWIEAVSGDPVGPSGSSSPAEESSAALSVADAEATEGVDETLDFVVRLEPEAAAAVTVDYRTEDGTATAGSDYTETRGTLTFAPGEDEKTVPVPITDDAMEDDGETFTLVLSNASGASFMNNDNEAVGTIRNTETTTPELTASLVDVPEAHDGESGFRFRVAFSEPIAISFRSLREDAFQVAGGRVTRGTRVDRRKDLFEITVEPDGGGEVAISLPAGRECTVSGAICTWGPPRKQLTNTPAATVAGPAAAPLTASFVDVPAEHDGETAFTLKLAFSEPLSWMNGRRLREDVVAVAGGRATSADRVNRRRDLWKLTVEPDSPADVTVTLSAGAACDTPAAVCTSDGRALSNTISTTAPGPVAVSVADARAREGADETIDFAVSLSRAASGTVAVAYATADGSATAGSDYTARKGQMTFVPGETAKTVSVPVLDDAHDEGEETFTLRLSAASGARIEDGEATGAIENSDPIPQAWLARFGRTVAGHVTDAIGERLSGPVSGGSQVTLGGRRLPFDGNAPETPDGAGPEADGLTAFADRLAAGSLMGRELLLGSSFRLALGGGNANSAGTSWTAWGRAAKSRFDGNADGLSLDGDVTTFTLGADAARSRWLAGVALAHSTGEGGYHDHPTRAGHPELGSGTLESTLTSVHPYARYRASERLTLWGTLGYGTGDLTLTVKGRDGAPDTRTDTDTGFRMAAAGARGVLLSAGDTDGFELAARADAQFARMTSEKADGLAATTANTSRLRLVLEGSRRIELAGGRTLTPTLEAGLRHDGGDAETGAGIEIGGGLRYADPALGLTAEAKARGLLAHEDSDYREWGASGSVRIDPGAMGRGLSLTLAPTWGAAASGVDRLWSLRDTGGLAANEEFEPQARLDAELGYGFAVLGGRFTATPYLGFGTSQGGRDYRAGWRLGAAHPDDLDLALGLEATRRESANDDRTAEHRIGLSLTVRW